MEATVLSTWACKLIMLKYRSEKTLSSSILQYVHSYDKLLNGEFRDDFIEKNSEIEIKNI